VKTLELFESSAKFQVEHSHGRFKRAQEMTLDKIQSSTMFSPAERKKISRLEVGSVFTTQSSTITGRSKIKITRPA
jgi:hypothetical protein